jgi:hypothetical protein
VTLVILVIPQLPNSKAYIARELLSQHFLNYGKYLHQQNVFQPKVSAE